MKPKIYLTRKIPSEGIELLKAHNCHIVINPLDKPVNRKILLKEIKDADGLLCMLSDRIDKEIIDAGVKLRVISNYAVGYDNIDVNYACKKNITVTNTPGILTEATAEITLALIFAVARRVTEADRFVRTGKFKVWSPTLLLGRDIHGKTLGIVGCGRIGQSVGIKAHGLGMKIIYYNHSAKPSFEKKVSARKISLPALLKQSDFVTLHIPLIEQTKYLVGLKELKMMKRTAYLINASRGPIVHESALVYALRHNIIAGAGLDVYEKEPQVHPGLLKLNNVTILPHLGSATIETRARMAIIAAENLIAVLEGKKSHFVVQPRRDNHRRNR
ncbi:MAG: D-glycerate dehydrogenase [Planctomycetota bacterium]|nr:D-glycerate dehydrogenase [Planctomycetota bacterium]MDI6786830.1 D-glycerate dehydrogenase [Planctomycetota bacterium]